MVYDGSLRTQLRQLRASLARGERPARAMKRKPWNCVPARSPTS
jgi:hypothetical protein